MDKPLGIGMVESGFVAGFRVRSWVGVRGADIVAVASRNQRSAKAFADDAPSHGRGALPSPGHRTWHAPPKSTPARAARGSGTDAGRAAACSTT